MRRSEPSERTRKRVPFRGNSLCKCLKEMRRWCFSWTLRNLRALKVEARGRNEGGEVNRDQRIRLYLKTTGSH